MTRPMFISCTDIHFTTKVPPCRLENYRENELSKFAFLMNEAENTEFKTILCAGDVFDSATKNMSYEFLSSLISIFRAHPKVQFMTVAGNHDMKYRDTSLSDTPLQFMATVLPIQFKILGWDALDAPGAFRFSSKDNNGIVFIHPIGWGDSISTVLAAFNEEEVSNKEALKNQRHIVLGHITTFEERLPHWADPKTCYTASDLIDKVDAYLGKYQNNLIITGDNHEQFSVLGHNASLINTGPIFRSTIDTKNIKPQYAEIWFDRARICNIPCEDDVFNQEYISKQRELKEATTINFDELVNEIDANYSMTNDFNIAIKSVVKSKHPELLSKLRKILDDAE